MLWAGSKPIDVYLGTRAFALCRGDEVLRAEPVVSFEAALTMALSQSDAMAASKSVHVWLSGGLGQPFMLPDTLGTNDPHELRRIAEGLANSQTSLRGECEIWLDTSRGNPDRVAVAVTKQTLSQIHETLGSFVRVVSIRPWWVDVLRAALDRTPRPFALGVHDCDSLTVLVGKTDVFERVVAVSPVFDRAAADAAFARALLSAGIDSDLAELARLTIAEPRSKSVERVALSPLFERAR